MYSRNDACDVWNVLQFNPIYSCSLNDTITILSAYLLMSQVPAKCHYSAAVCDHLQQQQQQHASPLYTAEECGLRNGRFEDSDPQAFFSVSRTVDCTRRWKMWGHRLTAIGVSDSEKVEATFGDKQNVRGWAKRFPERTQAAASTPDQSGALFRYSGGGAL